MLKIGKTTQLIKLDLHMKIKLLRYLYDLVNWLAKANFNLSIFKSEMKINSEQSPFYISNSVSLYFFKNIKINVKKKVKNVKMLKIISEQYTPNTTV